MKCNGETRNKVASTPQRREHSHGGVQQTLALQRAWCTHMRIKVNLRCRVDYAPSIVGRYLFISRAQHQMIAIVSPVYVFVLPRVIAAHLRLRSLPLVALPRLDSTERKVSCCSSLSVRHCFGSSEIRMFLVCRLYTA